MEYISEKIKKYFTELIDRKIYVIDVVECNANIQKILKEIENERKEHIWENDK